MPRPALLDFLATVPDPRLDRTRKHRLVDILMVTLVGFLGGATSFATAAAFAQCRIGWLKTFLALPNGVPSHDTLYRVFRLLDPKVFAAGFAAWAAEWMATAPQQVAIDGKALRGSPSATFSHCVHLVSAWATEEGLLLGQESVAEHANEPATIPALLEMLRLKGALVSIDAIGCKTSILKTIRQKHGDYLVAVKANQPTLLATATTLFATAIDADFAGHPVTQHASVERGHGRREERYVSVLATPDGIAGWPDVACVIQVNREREEHGRNTTTPQYYISSRAGTAEQMGRFIRRHWAVENELHWGLDVILGEDGHRLGVRTASANLGLVRRLAMSLLAKAPGTMSKPIKMVLAAGDPEFLKTILKGLQAI